MWGAEWVNRRQWGHQLYRAVDWCHSPGPYRPHGYLTFPTASRPSVFFSGTAHLTPYCLLSFSSPPILIASKHCHVLFSGAVHRVFDKVEILLARGASLLQWQGLKVVLAIYSRQKRSGLIVIRILAAEVEGCWALGIAAPPFLLSKLYINLL